MNIQLFKSFHKRENSTKHPSLSDQTSDIIAGYLREPTSIINPIVKFKRENFHFNANEHSPHIYTYAYMEDFERYYYIKDWVWQDGVWEAQMKVDVLASYAENIFQTNAYISRTSAPGYWNGHVIDRLYPAVADAILKKITFQTPWNDPETGYADSFFIMGVVGKNSNSGVNYYLLTPTQMYTFTSYLMSTDIYSNMGFGSALEPLSVLSAKAMYNPLQYVTSCFYFPMNKNTVSDWGQLENMNIGPYDVGNDPGEIRGIPAYRKWGSGGSSVGADWGHTITININMEHPQDVRGVYLNYHPYTRYQLIIPPFGVIPIDPCYFQLGDQLQLHIYMDGATGLGRLVINKLSYDATSQTYSTFVISEHSAMIGVPVQLNQVSVDYLKASIAHVETGSNLLSSALSLISGNLSSVGNAASSVANGVGTYVEAMSPQLLTEGTSGSKIGLYGQSCLEGLYIPIGNEDFADLGRPSLYNGMIAVVGNNGGDGTYIKCADVHIDFKCLEDERNQITNYLLGGFFYE